jgi:putative glutamine amidotransferase
MKKEIPKHIGRSAFGAFLVLSALALGLLSPELSAAPAREAPPAGGKVTIIAFFPSVGTIRDLMTLRQSRLIDVRNLEVVGVYHTKEITDYAKSQAFITEKSLDWFRLHPISAPIQAETVFKANALTPEFEKLFDQTDGVIFFGGADVPPSLYKEKTSFLTEIEDPFRHYLESSFAFHLLGGFQDEGFKPLLDRRPDFPVLGLCLGCQTLNVGTGGTLTQDIFTEIYGASTLEDAIALGPPNWHFNPYSRLFPREGYSGFFFHDIQFTQGGRFQKETGWKRRDHPAVLSSHHQQAEKLGKGFRTIASSLDGKIVEAIEHERFPRVLGVQFHPEAWPRFNEIYKVKFTPEDKEPLNLNAYLKGRPDSFEFHKKLWSWVSRGWVEQNRKK